MSVGIADAGGGQLDLAEHVVSGALARSRSSLKFQRDIAAYTSRLACSALMGDTLVLISRGASFRLRRVSTAPMTVSPGLCTLKSFPLQTLTYSAG